MLDGSWLMAQGSWLMAHGQGRPGDAHGSWPGALLDNQPKEPKITKKRGPIGSPIRSFIHGFFMKLYFKELDFKELGVLGYLLGVLGYSDLLGLGVPDEWLGS